jgi:peptidyl-prolyl cis-trans isomerase A (cyclophilin A)
MRTRIAVLTSLAALLAGACGKQSSPSGAPPPASPQQPPPQQPPTAPGSPLRDPSKLTEQAPATFRVKFATTKGDFVLEVQRDWAPRGADRFYNLVKAGFYDKVKFFRAIKGFMVQFGINGDPAVSRAWANANIPDDSVVKSNTRGYITFATAGPNTRTTQVFINLVDNKGLDARGFSPFGQVVSGMEVVDSLYMDYGEGAPGGAGPSQGRIEAEGNAYLERDFPRLDAVNTAALTN